MAKIAHDMNILTVGMVTLPFSHEGERKMNTAKDGVDLLRQNMDALVVVNNDNIEKLPEFRRITVGETFSTVDEVLRQSIGSIVEMIEIPSHPWFLATQAHPELKSRPNRPHPLFRGFIKAALDYQENK